MSSLEIPDLITKQELIVKIVAYPLEFTEAEFKLLVNPKLQLNFADLRQLLLRIFDLNETSLRMESDATTGILGQLNRLSTTFRHTRYYQKIKQGFRNPKYIKHKVIVAEGDSWFQFPFFIKDIIDWLSNEPNYAVYSLAYGGDWFTNILYDEKYIEELSIHRPEVFLISGGGNDLLSFNRLAIMVNAKNTTPLRPWYATEKMLAQETEQDKEDIRIGYRYITKDFYSFIWTIKAQYYQLFQRLQDSGKFTDMQIITQGYDYAIPTYKTRWKKWYALQPMLNRMIGSGKWLKRPLMIKGITDEVISRKIMKTIIFEVNYLFAELAQTFANVYHIDCRGTAITFDDWFDELHLHSEKFKQIAQAYKQCIENPPSNKIIKVVRQPE